MNLLVLSPVLPHAPVDGGRLRIYHFIRELSKQHRITLVSFCAPDEDLGEAGLGDLRHMVAQAHLVSHSRLNKIWKAAHRYPTAEPANVSAYVSGRMERLVKRLSDEQPFDGVLAFRLGMARYGLMVDSPVKLLDFTDSMTLFYRRRAEAEKNAFKKSLYRREEKRLGPWEAALCDMYDASFVNGEDDRQCLASFLPWRPPKLVVNGVDRNFLKPSRKAPGRSNRNIVFVGALHYPPNTDGLDWFCAQVLPLLKKKDDKIQLNIVGAGAPASLKHWARDSAVRFMGHLDDFRAVVREAAVSVCPIRYGAGRQNKILEAFALGTPVVATSLTARLAEAADKRHLLTADDAQKFADQVWCLMTRPEIAARLKAAALKLVEKKYDWNKSAKIINRALIKGRP